jgi:hypothetical protein
VLFPHLYGKCEGITRKDGARPALPKLVLNFVVVMYVPILLLLSMGRSLYSVCSLCVNVYCTTAVGCLCVNV